VLRTTAQPTLSGRKATRERSAKRLRVCLNPELVDHVLETLEVWQSDARCRVLYALLLLREEHLPTRRALSAGLVGLRIGSKLDSCPGLRAAS
jgi:hypothetical protein